MIYLKIIIILSIIYLFFCLFLLSYNKYKKGKNPFILGDKIDETAQEIQSYIIRDKLEKQKKEDDEAIEEFKSMS
jgi:hypothetical protein